MKPKEENISLIIEACVAKKRDAQKRLFELYYAYGMSIALRYSKNKTDAEEVLNDSFVKVFNHIDKFDSTYSFKSWFRRILINTGIDSIRKQKVKYQEYHTYEQYSECCQNEGLDNLQYDDVLNEIQKLPEGYRKVFNLYAIDGFKHREIAALLDISVGTSKSNYSRARTMLQNNLQKQNKENFNHG